ncbi:glycosyltransferase family 2 protein [Sulfitobacter guttiformis]|uniref:GT2 family glycosyltransferase n=1 Tax=Sulfitobacter guttiformis TaxID=74349 RepID=A0A420DP89_9RHOB|nr:glycosyltransferase family 2 protein [Sulfitobacter guttiformis]KIN73328.1 Glycosyl transferase, family 2 [Sulfitobacter guttiformis KCTC 32187]RKE95998.1 GT2 family glycosyltransferase [Sulfitobacter guttiformis]
MLNTTVTIVTVCHNSMAVLPAMLKSVPAGTPVIMVDNASSDTSALQKLADEHGVELLLNTDNIGFGPACNQGAAKAQTEFLLFLNPDAELQPDALDALIAAAEKHKDASGFNPRILDGKGRQSFRRGSKLRPKERLKGPVPTSDTELSVLVGSAIFCRRALFERIGGFDPAIFMYHEDDDLSLRLREHGPLIYCHDAQVVHLSGHGSPRVPAVAAFKAYHSARSRVYALGKHGHPSPGLNTLLAAAFRLMGLDTLFIKRKRSKNMGYMRGALSALKDGGRNGSE